MSADHSSGDHPAPDSRARAAGSAHPQSGREEGSDVAPGADPAVPSDALGADSQRTRKAVRGAVLANLAPVRPLRPPFQRGLWLVPVGLLLLAAQPLYWGVRGDAAVLGWLRLWGLSAAQTGLGVALVAAALREAVPGRRLRRAQMWLAVGVLASVAITLATWYASATHVPQGRVGRYWMICFTRPVMTGLPVLAGVLALAWRAYPLRASVVGALAGLSAGLMTDAGWRTYCHVSDPVHVLSAHLAAVLALAFAGAASAAFLAHLRD